MEPLVLTFDVGTQSIRALLAKKDGTFLDTEQYKYPVSYYSKQPFWAEQPANFYYDCLCKVSKALLERNKKVINDIKCVTLTTIRDTVICLDEENKPLTDYIVWLDKRGACFDPNKVGALKTILLKVVGMYDTIQMQTRESACNWLMQNDPQTWARTKTYALLSTHLDYLLTGEMVDSIGAVIGHIPFDYKTGKWMDLKALTRCIYDVPTDKLFKLVNPGETIGYINEKASKETLIPVGLPLIATGSDKGCETIGLSVTDLRSAAISFGTSSTIQLASEKYIEPQPFCPAYPAALPHLYNLEYQIYRGYWMLSWFIKEFCQEESRIAKEHDMSTEELMNSHLWEIPAGCDGLLIQPYWTGGLTNPLARGSMLGFNDRQSKYHIYRAIIEGINFELYGALKKLEKRTKTKIEELYVGGGGARSDEIMQISADMFGLPVRRIQTHEASGLGSSLVGFVAMGEFKDVKEATKAMIHVKDTFYPNKETHEFYVNMYNKTYSKIYKRLEHIYAEENSIFKKEK